MRTHDKTVDLVDICILIAVISAQSLFTGFLYYMSDMSFEGKWIGDNRITKTVTIVSVSDNGFIDSDGNGYIFTPWSAIAGKASLQMISSDYSQILLPKKYDVMYFCSKKDNTRRVESLSAYTEP